MSINELKFSVNNMKTGAMKKLLRSPNGSEMFVFWVWLLELAAEKDDEGLIYFTRSLPYTNQDFSEELHMDESTIELALHLFEDLEMIENNDGFIRIINWDNYLIDYESIVEEGIKSYNREAQKRSRELKKQSNCNYVNDKSMTNYQDFNDNSMIDQSNVNDKSMTNHQDFIDNSMTSQLYVNDKSMTDVNDMSMTYVNDTNSLISNNTNKKVSKKVSKKLFIYSENEKNNSFDDEEKKHRRLSWNDLIDNSDFDFEVKELLKSKWLPYKSQCLKASNSKLSNDAVIFCLEDLANLSSDKKEQMKIIKKAIQSGDYSFSDLKNKSSKGSQVDSMEDSSSKKDNSQMGNIVIENDGDVISDDSYHCDLDKEEFYDFALNGKTTDEEWEEYYDKDPIAFLESKQKHPVASANKRLLKDLQKKYNLGNGAINVLVEYILAFKNQRLQRSYVETIASEWAREGVHDVKSARKKGRNILASIRSEILSSYFPPEADEKANDEYNERSSDGSEDST